MKKQHPRKIKRVLYQPNLRTTILMRGTLKLNPIAVGGNPGKGAIGQ